MGAKPDKVSELIEKNGSNDLQMRVADFLEQKGWKVSFSPYYVDLITGRSREIDIIATFTRDIGVLDVRSVKYYVRLFIECKYVKDATVFYMRDKDMASAREMVKGHFPLGQYGAGLYEARLHSLDQCRVAKNTAKSGHDDIYDALNQSLHGLIFYEDVDVPGPYHLDLPLVVIDSFSNVYQRDDSERGYSRIEKPFQFEVDYSYKEFREGGSSMDKTRYFLVDIASEHSLEDFLEDIQKRDVTFLSERLSGRLSQMEMDRQRRSDNAWRDSTK